MTKSSVSIAIAGYGGTGVITTGQLLLKAASNAGYFGLAQRSFGPQIRGGESLSLLRLANHPVQNPDDSLDLLVLLDCEHVARFRQEVVLTPNTCVIIGHAEGAHTAPDFVTDSGATVIWMPLDEIAEKTAAGGENIVAAGLIASLLELPENDFVDVVATHFRNKPELGDKAKGWIQSGLDAADDCRCAVNIELAENSSVKPSWLTNGSGAAAFGALKAGIRFVAAYPITPASGVLEWLAPNIEKIGGRLIQAEDELASINMIIGSSFGGVPSMTATSGPGLALMAESIGLAVASETPLLVFNVMRGGPSTGIPTKSEQSDLNIALHGLHGDAPHIVTAALSIADSAFTAGWSVWLAENLQTPVIALSDQSIAQSDAAITQPTLWHKEAKRLTAAASDEPYDRYALTESGISPMAIPGEDELMYTGDGLEHNAHGTPSAAAEHHQQQLDKRANKLTEFDYGDHWADINGEGSTVIICWGSVSSAAAEACKRLNESGTPCRVISLRLLAPLQTQALDHALVGVTRLLVVEQSHGAQFIAWIRSKMVFQCELHSLAIPGPLPIRPGMITDAIHQWDNINTERPHAVNS
ncbi:2-oxoglutarate oxidoreductase subunit KorA [BD1-7 clade bacterium]|uniref:2-oxoglutarate oxidoreductase subunit KorA n=1 Tax=BD1-7 clade bacterium TaxID=2029982 RepID=A0A5S9QQ41_9GAMM|nr:2-oxoglutarate oxidoreductase subunit KorA [BD1-7 clade bacterium]